MSWTLFTCDNPDFFVHSVPDDFTFGARRAALQTSKVFQDMFEFCDPDASSPQGDIVRLQEPVDVLAALLRLLHSPPDPPVLLPRFEPVLARIPKDHYDAATIIPLPLLSTLILGLVDKYMLPDKTMDNLGVHLIAHAPVYPLEVFSLSLDYGLDKVTAAASQFMAPLASYKVEDVKKIYNLGAYHQVLQLQNLRVSLLRSQVLTEDIFPHGYGVCSDHQKSAESLWDRTRQALAVRIETDTDVSGEMKTLSDSFKNCKVCSKACTAAVEMLAYKSRKIPRRIDQLPK